MHSRAAFAPVMAACAALVGCASRSTPRARAFDPPPRVIVPPQIATRDANAASSDASASVDNAGPRGELAADPLAACRGSLESLLTEAHVEYLAESILPLDQREYPADGADTPVRARIARVRSLSEEYLVVVGPLISGVDDESCSRVVAFDWSPARRRQLSVGPMAVMAGAPSNTAAYAIRAEGPYAGALLVVFADAHGNPEHVRFFDGGLRAEAMQVFADGDSLRVDYLEDGMDLGGPRGAMLLGLDANGLHDIASTDLGFTDFGPCWEYGRGAEPTDENATVPRCMRQPAGGFEVLVRGANPRLRERAAVDSSCVETTRRGCAYREFTLRFANDRFVRSGGSRTVRLPHRVIDVGSS